MIVKRTVIFLFLSGSFARHIPGGFTHANVQNKNSMLGCTIFSKRRPSKPLSLLTFS
ncbi:Uncharacterized protein APZ42_021253 [Daphnia magna]|uniref:Uncharacterized protein n=1 Tax=Daphnia magna TaxID=35525 RepID=A0A164WU74_9CRUS|nr:Uncharacterized protein APZ42_021253 [Daphnia magna]